MGQYRGPKRLDLILAYADALFLREMRERSYRIYMTSALKGFFGIQGKTWDEVAYSENVKPEKTADEVLNSLVKRGGLVAKHEPT